MAVRLSSSICLLFICITFASGIITCPDIDPVSYADISTSAPSPYRIGTVANFTCDAGFKGVGKSSITCLTTGRWSGSVPYCTRYICKRDLRKLEKDRKCRKRCKTDAQCRGVFKRCVCDDWCGKSCFNPVADCPQLSPPANGYILKSGISYGHTVTYGCNDGFILTGTSTRRCRSDRKWSGYSPLCVPFSTCGQSGEMKRGKVAGKVTDGTDAKQGAWPWQVLLIRNQQNSVDQIYNSDSGFGGGTVINDEWILSAAHVFQNFPEALRKKNWKNKFLIVAGMTAYPSRGLEIPEHISIFQPRSVYNHPKFNKLNFDYDVALVRVGNRVKRDNKDKFVVDPSAPKNIVFSRFIRPVCLPCMKGGPSSSVDLWKNFDKAKCNPRGKSIFAMLAAAGSRVMVTGFGMKTDHGDNFQYVPNHLQEGMLTIVRSLKCSESVNNIRQNVAHVRFTNRMFCASGVNKTARVDSCQGDSGGPVVKSMRWTKHTNYWLQIGIVSWGWECGGAHPGYYTSVPSIMSWIWKILDDTRIGTWKKWGAWSRCSKTCGGGIRSRRRSCQTKNCRGGTRGIGTCNTGRCPPALQCSPVRSPPHGSMKKSPVGKYNTIGSTVTFSCQNGYFISSGPTKIVCQPNGRWSNLEKPVCKAEWSQWTAWSDCSATCGGVQTKSRVCRRKKDVITALLGCKGSLSTTKKCGAESCPTGGKTCGQGSDICLFGKINVNRNRVSSQISQIANQFGGLFGKKR